VENKVRGVSKQVADDLPSENPFHFFRAAGAGADPAPAPAAEQTRLTLPWDLNATAVAHSPRQRRHFELQAKEFALLAS